MHIAQGNYKLQLVDESGTISYYSNYNLYFNLGN